MKAPCLLAAAILAAASAVAGSRKIPYDETIRDRLWMWGHNPYLANVIHEQLLQKGDRTLDKLEVRPNIEMADACRYMGIPNVCAIMFRDMDYELADYCQTLRGMKRVAWGVSDGDDTKTKEEKKRIADKASRLLPNLTTLYLDDYFCSGVSRYTLDEITELKGRQRLRGTDLAVVLYLDQNGVKEEYRAELERCETISLWMWEAKNLAKAEEGVRKCRAMVGKEKELLLGIYMWDFGGGEKPIPANVMRSQLEVAYKLLKERTIDGLIFHCTPFVAFDLEAVKISRAWIAQHGDERLTPPEPGVTVTGTGAGAEAARAFLRRHGIPVVADAAVCAIFGDAVRGVGDAELKGLLERGGLLIDDSAAELIAKRGFGDLVKVGPDDPVVPDPRVRRRPAKKGWTVIVPTDGECRSDVVRADVELAGAVSLEPLVTDRLEANAQAKAAMEKAPLALRPVPQVAREPYCWWMQCFLYKRAEAAWTKDRAKVVFCGDSITQLFGGEAWDESFGSGKYMAVNCGISGDRTENLIFRLMNGALDNTDPKAAVLLIGVNNVCGRPDEPAETTADAVWQCVARIRTAQPKGSKLVLNAIFPCFAKPDDPRRVRVAKVNALLKARLAKLDAESRGNILWLDMTDDFLAPDGTLPKELFPDGLHPSQAGYRKWAARLKPLLDQAL